MAEEIKHQILLLKHDQWVIMGYFMDSGYEIRFKVNNIKENKKLFNPFRDKS